jgi:head-tail adaptor
MPYKADISSFTRKVDFKTVVSTKSGMGGPTKTYTHSFYWWMSRQQATSSQEQYVNSRIIIPGRYTYRGHYKSTINETMQLVDGSEKFNIVQVNPDDRKLFIEIIVEKITE